jgi:NADPH-dependent 2,4-dienoyl-CoA reductase/sulfur reductase-like enzyme/rhodanese-related sulfurtransferase
MPRKIVIIGGVATGPKTAARCRRLDQEAEITIVERGDLLSYAACGMPFYIEGVIEEYDALFKTTHGVCRDAEYFWSSMGVRVLENTEAVKIDRGAKTVTVRNLKTGETEDLLYDKLVLATGASPFVPKMDGVELEGMHRLYNPHHARAIKEALDRGARKVAIVGGGLIGMETCGAFVERECKVTVFEMMPHLVPALLDEEMALLLEKHLVEKGVKVVKGSPVSRIIDNGAGRVGGVETADGRKFEADLVIVAIGVRPNTGLAADAGLDIGPTRAIAVNEHLQTSDPDIYAGGDCVENANLVTGEKVYAPMGSTANKHGRIIADNINGMKTTFPGVTSTAVFRIIDYNCGATGITERRARQLGYDVVTSLCPRRDYSHYIPGAKFFVVKLIAERKDGRVLGCQVVGEGDGVKRIDVVATVLKFGGDVKALADLDLGYAPPYSEAMDAIAHAANVIRNKIDGLAHGVSLVEMKRKLESDEDFVFIDCRENTAYEEQTIKNERTRNIPLTDLKDRSDEVPKYKEIIFFCNTSVRAYKAERIMRSLGYGDVKFLEGSLNAWPYSLEIVRK